MYTSLEQSTNSLLKENLMRGNTDKDEKQGGRDVVTHRDTMDYLSRRIGEEMERVYPSFKSLLDLHAYNMQKKDGKGLTIKGQVSEQLKDSDEIICDLASSDLWITVDVMLRSTKKSIIGRVEVKVSRNMNIQIFERILQKISISFWNHKCDEKENYYYVLRQIKIKFPPLKDKEKDKRATNRKSDKKEKDSMDLDSDERCVGEYFEFEGLVKLRCQFSTLEDAILHNFEYAVDKLMELKHIYTVSQTAEFTLHMDEEGNIMESKNSSYLSSSSRTNLEAIMSSAQTSLDTFRAITSGKGLTNQVDMLNTVHDYIVMPSRPNKTRGIDPRSSSSLMSSEDNSGRDRLIGSIWEETKDDYFADIPSVNFTTENLRKDSNTAKQHSGNIGPTSKTFLTSLRNMFSLLKVGDQKAGGSITTKILKFNKFLKYGSIACFSEEQLEYLKHQEIDYISALKLIKLETFQLTIEDYESIFLPTMRNLEFMNTTTNSGDEFKKKRREYTQSLTLDAAAYSPFEQERQIESARRRKYLWITIVVLIILAIGVILALVLYK